MKGRLPAVTDALSVLHRLHGVVVSAGLMEKTVKVRVGGQQWNDIVKKTFARPKHYLVHDPNSSLRTGDVVSIRPGWRTSKQKRHLVEKIIAPYGTPIEERPPIPSLQQVLLEYEEKRAAKARREAARRKEEHEKRREANLKKAAKK
ncbi:hypothetical protein B0I35DRAFT_476323 [Stachybotrys elegans]|uniref:Ribosomal protein S17 n=1 Tax=Stachybotrys elegans TaxID=80388 RepID=A0A8K0SWW3_9HYPO|nr:hypothetical protein B0I35DRAFT_476323 [Stachybotrys elegans]